MRAKGQTSPRQAKGRLEFYVVDLNIPPLLSRKALADMGVTIAFRGGASGPRAPARLCELWPMESVWADRKEAQTKFTLRSTKWSKGVGVSCNKNSPLLDDWAAAVLGVVRRVKTATVGGILRGLPNRVSALISAKGGPIKA